ncbi:protein FAM161A-like isoform X2 [Siniperca chuatsi]|uniref:protein FAM161A-like isoform X2 n=1 Tax=Siniperca chuatsi TaxID=119488 RepID=UPI001CE11710|nr:protein FAM161A-like isoform X2 [Siniperca chuatsi]
MATIYRSPSLENEELMALYGGERDHYFVDEDCTSEEYDLDSECSEEGKCGRSVRRSLSLEIYGLQREQHVYFSNQEYYRRLEELKSAHLRNMAELEMMYISQGRERHGEDDDGGLGRGQNREARLSISGPAKKLQRINSQEELDFHETSSGSDQSELCGADRMGELQLDNPRKSSCQDRTFGRDILKEMATQKQFRFQPRASCPKPQGKLSRQIGVRVRSNSKVTVPKPFQMMLREEERKRHKVRTRSEIELENTLLRRELEELQECQKKFRASPAPAHIHLPLYEIISRRSSQRSNRNRSRSNNSNRDTKSNQASAAASPQPFHFLERERRKREAKIVTELGKLGPKEERQTFKARPMPSLVYGTRHRADTKITCCQPQSLTWLLEREATEGQSDPNSDLEPDVIQSKSDTSPASRMPQRCPSSKPVKKQIELSIEMVKERQWSNTDPLKATTCNIYSPLQPGGPEPLLSNKTDYVSV